MNSVNLSGIIQSEKIELRETPNQNIPVTSFLLKVQREHSKLDSDTTENFDIIKIVCWSGMAKYVVENYKYGMAVEVKGSIRTGRRKLKEYKVLKNGKQKSSLYIPTFEIYAQRVGDFSQSS